MILIDQIKELWEMTLHPGANTKREMSIKDSILFFYKSTFLLMVIGAILLMVGGTALLKTFGSSSSAAILGAFTGTAVNVLLVVFVVIEWLLLPIGALISAGILQLFGKYLFRVFKKGYSNTYTANIYTTSVSLLLYLIVAAASTVLFFISPILALIGILLLVIALIWSIVVGLLALANQQGTTWVKALLVEIGIWIVVIIIWLAITAL